MAQWAEQGIRQLRFVTTYFVQTTFPEQTLPKNETLPNWA